MQCRKLLRKSSIFTLSICLTLGIIFTPSPPVHAEAVPLDATATMNWNVEYQSIDGFGASQNCDVYAEQLYNFGARDEIMNLLFSKDSGIGLSIMRSEVGNGLNMPSIQAEEGKWDFTPYAPEQWVLQEARNRGVETFMSTVWSPPAWMKTNGRIVRGGSLKKEHYRTFAEYLARYVKEYKERFNIKFDAISIANEPEYAAPWQSCLWSKEDFANFLSTDLGPVFKQEGLDTKIIVGEEATWTEKRLDAVYNNPDALAAMDIVGAHYYHGKPHVFEQANAHGKRVWETEVSDTMSSSTDFKDGIKWARYVHNFMTEANANAFLYWLGASYKKNNESLIRLHQDGSYTAAKRLFMFGNFSKYVRPGDRRIDITENPQGNVHLSAYKNAADGRFTIVAVNDGDTNEVVKLRLDGADCGMLSSYVSNERYNLEKAEDISLKDGYFRLPISGYTVITYTGTLGTSPAEESSWRMTDELDNWDLIHSRSDGFMLESVNPYGAFDDDNSQARRSVNQNEEIVYQLADLKDFELSLYYFKNKEGIRLESSTDLTSWAPVTWHHTPPRLTGGFWEHIFVRPDNPLPDGTQYLKITFAPSSIWAWDKHLARVQLR